MTSMNESEWVYQQVVNEEWACQECACVCTWGRSFTGVETYLLERSGVIGGGSYKHWSFLFRSTLPCHDRPNGESRRAAGPASRSSRPDP